MSKKGTRRSSRLQLRHVPDDDDIDEFSDAQQQRQRALDDAAARRRAAAASRRAAASASHQVAAAAARTQPSSSASSSSSSREIIDVEALDDIAHTAHHLVNMSQTSTIPPGHQHQPPRQVLHQPMPTPTPQLVSQFGMFDIIVVSS